MFWYRHKKTKYVDPNIEVYKMNHKRRGIALIFNNVKIYPARNNAEECSRNLSQTLQMMGFDVQLIVNATLQMLIEKLKDGKYSKINKLIKFLFSISHKIKNKQT